MWSISAGVVGGTGMGMAGSEVGLGVGVVIVGSVACVRVGTKGINARIDALNSCDFAER